MHGRRRTDLPVLSEAKQEAQRQKVKQAFELLDRLLAQRTSAIPPPGILCSTRKLIEFNPELCAIWSYRRRILTQLSELRQWATGSTGSSPSPSDCRNVNTKELQTGSSGEETSEGASTCSSSPCSFCQRDHQLSELLRDELELTTSLLAKGDSKAYCLWLHRSWTLARLAAHEYARHMHHLPHGSSERFSAEGQNAANNFEKEKEADQQQQQGEEHRDGRCRCCFAPCLASAPAAKSRTRPLCGLDGALELLHEELQACQKMMQKVDGRNFHCWQHRSMVLVWHSAFLLHKKTQQCNEEKQSGSDKSLFLSPSCMTESATLTRSLIESDFSNYSAWHLRSLLPETRERVTEEFSWLWQGLYTEPADQSLWQYYTWLLTRAGGMWSGRLLAVRNRVSSVGGSSLFFFFAEPCALNTACCRIERLGEKVADGVTVVKGTWTALSHLYTARVSGFTASLSRREDKLLSRVWEFKVDANSTKGPLSGRLRVHLALSRFSGPVTDSGKGIDAFHLQRLQCHAPELRAVAFPAAQGLLRAEKREAEEDLDTCAAKEVYRRREGGCSAESFLWKCHTLTPCRVSNEAGAAASRWALSDAASCTARCCPCTAETRNVTPTEEADAEAAANAEAVAAAGGSLSQGISLDVAQQEMSNIEELLLVEPGCKGALHAKLRLLRVLRPHAFAEYADCCGALMAVDAVHERMHRDEAVSADVRAKILKQMPQSGAFSQVCVNLDGSDIERLPYPLLLQATDAGGLSLRNNPMTNETMLDWHVPHLPWLRNLDVRGTKISQLSLLLISVAQLPLIERVDASFTELRPMSGTCALEEDEELQNALQSSTLMEIDVTATPFAASVPPRTVVYKCLQLCRADQEGEVPTACFLRKIDK